MDKKYQVFVSSTYADLEDERDAVIQAILELGCIPSGMELFPAANDEQWTLIKRVIDECDYYLVIVAGRYGTRGPDGQSYTEMEYRYALEKNKPVMGFIHGDPTSLPAKRCEQTEAGHAALNNFRKLVMSKMVKKWASAHELGSHVKTSLIESIRHHPAVGWVRANTIPQNAVTAQDFFKQDDYPSDLNSLFEGSTTAIFWGAAFNRFVQHMKERIEHHLTKDVQIRFLMMEPEGAALDMLNLRGKPEDIPHRKTDLKRNISILNSLSRVARPGQLEVKVLDYLAPYSLVAFDSSSQAGRMYVWLGTLGVPNAERPMFSLARSSDPQWFDFFINQFEMTWNLADAVEA